MAVSVTIFLSTVSDEFRLYRDQLRTDLTRHNVEVKVQEDFKDLGGDTLDKLDVYIAHCDAVVHLVGDMTGAHPGERELRALLAKYSDLTDILPSLGEALKIGVGVSYTQWEAWLALYHSKLLLTAKAAETAERGPKYAPTRGSRVAQAAHLARLEAVKRFAGCTFTGPADLAKHIAYTAILDLLAKARAEKPAHQLRNLPFASLGPLLKGRDKFLDRLHEALASDKDQRAMALHGLGGVGKTRLAVEYALNAFSLASRASGKDGKASGGGFAVHRLVQDFTMRGMLEEHRRGALKEALDWVSAGFTGDPHDVRTWPVLDPLAPHALALALHGDEAGIAEPTARFYNQLGLLFSTKARSAEAEPMMRRALAIDEASYGPDHPHTLMIRTNLASLARP
jgi:hypothetical protein